jgi:hypothetical protein
VLWKLFIAMNVIKAAANLRSAGCESNYHFEYQAVRSHRGEQEQGPVYLAELFNDGIWLAFFEESGECSLG